MATSHTNLLEPRALTDRDLERMLTIRHFELALLDAFDKGFLNGTTHTCLGQEHVAVAAAAFLRPDDFELSNHRGHGHYLARFGDVEGLLAEIMGREGAVCLGVGGSQHVLRPGQYMSTGIQGESLPIAVGVALELRRARRDGIVVVHVGDGTIGEGAFYEALNMAKLWRLPVLTLVENNGVAQSTPTKLQMAGTIEDRARAFGVAFARAASVDVVEIRAALEPVFEACRETREPAVVELVTTRLGPHSKGDDARPAAERELAKAADWYPYYERAFPDRIARLEQAARERVAAIVADVSSRPPSRWEAAR